jgi:acyl CoA:acetate/3-ketoacid CoA transferase beta subunit
MSDAAFSTSELMVAAGARELRDGQVVVAGLGIPLIAAILAKRTHAPRLVLLNEIGVADPHPVEFGVGNADPRLWYGAGLIGGFVDIMGNVLHRGLVDVGFLGALEVDLYGNVNSTHVRRDDGGLRRFGGGGGANDLSSLAKEIIVIIRHEQRKLVERVLHSTSPGFLEGGRSREQSGLRGGGPYRVLTDKAVFGFDRETRRLKLLSVHPGVSHQELRASTGFPLEVPADCPATPAPIPEEIRLIREELDPGRLYTSGL